MTPRTHNSIVRFGLLAAAAVILAGCPTLDRLSSVGETPKMTKVDNPTRRPNYRPVSMPMPAPVTARRQANSLWRAGSRAFFKDLRASQVGDIVSVTVSINDAADISNSTTRTRTNSEDAGLDAFLGYEAALNAILPESVQPGTLLDLDSVSSSVGTGVIDRDEVVTLKIAAVVTQVLPNGNLVIHGRQETRVNFEVREIQIAGVIRPQDIDSSNTITYDKIAEARLAYGGRGHITDVQQPRYGQQIVDILFPF